MPLESASFINGLVSSNPADTDSEGQGAAHLRLIKAALQGTFPNVTGPITATSAALSKVGSDGNSGAPAVAYNADATAGFYRSATGEQTIVGKLRGDGAVPLGSMHWFPADPGTTIVARGGTATGTEQYVECDGSTYPTSKFPALAASPFVTVSGSNFSVPQLNDTGRFVRARTSSLTIGSAQTNQNASHTHGVTDPGHTHTVTDPGHVHAITDPGHIHSAPVVLGASVINGNSNIGGSGGSGGNVNIINSNTTGITINSHTTGITNVSNTTGITLAAQGGTETRPEAFVAMCVLKT
jgi:hypothetical protein